MPEVQDVSGMALTSPPITAASAGGNLVAAGQTTILAVLKGVEQQLSGDLSADDLRVILGLFDEAAFVPQLKKFLSDQSVQGDWLNVRDTITRIMRKAEERAATLETQREFIVQGALVGGVALVAGGFVGFAQASDAIYLLLAVGGIVMAVAAYLGVRSVDSEKTLYGQMSNRLDKVEEAIRP